MFTHAVAIVAIAAVFIVGGIEGTRYWNVGRFIESTDDAYVKADATIIAPKVSGYVADVTVDDNQPVKAGQLLARIDDHDLRNALDGATADVTAAIASLAHLDAQLAAQGSLIRQADASATAAAASLDLAQRNDARRRTMAQVGYGSVEQADNASTSAKQGRAELDRLQAAALTARDQVTILRTQRQLAQAQLAAAEAAKHQAELNLSYAGIVAPIDGTVGNRTVRRGQYVQAGTQLMALVPLQHVYVIANFKETQLTGVEPGQRVHVRVDTFPGHDIIGRVDTIAPASGMEFSLLPPDNATGNFTKIVQRIPVKILFPLDDALVGHLRPGMSVEASIDTRAPASGRIQGE
ncbi:HlyD family secretion protein [Pseudomonas sp. C2L12B]|uniref:HlyD family secretion protein n=2 Tax=Pseudomonas typographi TaxID=2715964 RepID=A0ABR7Z2E6_9PSED|nr:HlyD family secretion protein [Pseudomonas typographi]MBD1585967.1 HlyD family secretion protein [Pseudomonas typographi]MBD1599668.1 HlyD family secretion protein [Pseudomonas typographi]